ncbi:competence protein CoiA [Maribacter flavus]|uniref:Competence protein n=1 Tax=Maribacter flavus TaxID=1658664 RepID=A0A5B2TTX3_9FLAO|nr:competence protein CoiA family protein [Maribacter flavus]KAA2217215.1 competence protein [Maribacter flavus]
MRFATINNSRVEAQPKLKGICSCCSKPVIAKCGTRKIWHWAHKRKVDCDNWWETETQWHRNWKNNYPDSWQEISLTDERSGEKHIADVRTDNNLVIEFQHSFLDPQERNSREQFYKNMVWIIDGTRLKRDYPRFLNEWKSGSTSEVQKTEKPGIFKIWFPEFCFPKAWLNSAVPVIFDFYGDGTLDDPEGMRNSLYCLFPQVGKHARVAEISRNAFLQATNNGEWTSRVQEFIREFKIQDKVNSQQQALSHQSNKVEYRWNGVPLIGGKKEYRKRVSKSNKSFRKGKR